MRTIARVTLVALLAAGSARAEDACRADVERLCPGIPEGGGRIAACLKANAAQVSAPCKAELASVQRKVKEVGEACADDVRSYCSDVTPGQGHVLQCLTRNQGSLTPRCQEVIQGAREKLAEFRKACRGDAKKLCKGIQQGQGRVFACLKSKEAELSAPCQALMR